MAQGASCAYGRGRVWGLVWKHVCAGVCYNKETWWLEAAVRVLVCVLTVHIRDFNEIDALRPCEAENDSSATSATTEMRRHILPLLQSEGRGCIKVDCCREHGLVQVCVVQR